ncbi:MAG: hypothetical protein IT480_09940 [Gammaproteobacteria bacterium]|nr:hypothetical protein [Gammaproteobacteria bacterium]
MANIFEQRLLSPVGRRTAAGAVLDIRLPWYRSLPLSTVEVASLCIDGRPVPAERMRFELNGRTYRLADIGEQVQEYWFVTDSAYLHVDDATLLSDGHSVELTLNLYPPYIPHLTWVTRSQQTLRAA